MKSRWIILSCGIMSLAACDSIKKAADDSLVAKDDTAPGYFFLEAEDCEIFGQKAEDGKASGSACVMRRSSGYQPVLRCDIPVSGKPLSVWMRRKGGAVQIKTSSPGSQEEGTWVYGSEEQFVWSSFGEIAPGGEGRQLIAIGNNREDETVSIDCILFSEAPLDDKDSLLTPLPPVSIDPSKTTGGFHSAPELWGMNLFSGSDPKSLANQSYVENMAYLAPRLARVHNAGMMADSGKSRHGLLDFKSRTWDERKVRLAVVGLLELKNVGEIVINIPNWPEWMDADGDGFLDDDQAAEYATLVGRFAEIVWEFPEARKRVLFELTNECDNQYHADLVAVETPHRVAGLARIFLQCSLQIRGVAPGARIGGPSVGNPANTDFHEQFIAYTAPELDFYSIHMYASGEPGESDSRLLSRADSAMQPVKSVKGILAKNSKAREIPVSVNEYNIAPVSEANEPRMSNGFGAVWDAWFVMTLFTAGADSAAAWNENDGIHGKFSPAGERRPASHLYHVLNTEFAGSVARLETEEPEDIAALTTEAGNRLLISHRGLRDRRITLPEGKWTGWMLGKGIDVQREITVDGETDMPGVSLIYLER